jgi:hypothetical protein
MSLSPWPARQAAPGIGFESEINLFLTFVKGLRGFSAGSQGTWLISAGRRLPAIERAMEPGLTRRELDLDAPRG